MGARGAPGIIDTHARYDAQICWDRTPDPSSRLGVRTAVIVNCGFTIARSAEFHELVGLLGDVGHGLFMLTQGSELPVTWSDVPERISCATGVPIMIAPMMHNESLPQRAFERFEGVSRRRSSAARGSTARSRAARCPSSCRWPHPARGLHAQAAHHPRRNGQQR